MAQLPLELLDWSPDGRRVALRARTAPGDVATALFIATADTLIATRFGEPLLVGGRAAGMLPHKPLALWTDNRRLLVTIADDRPMTLEAAAHRLVPTGKASLLSGASIIWPADPNTPTTALVVASSTSDAVVLDQIDPR